MDNSIIPIIKELERIYDEVNTKFGFTYTRPVIVIQTKGSKKDTLGWFGADRWKQDKKEIGEITICAESLNKNPIETLIHEMAHYANHCEKIADCNNQQYHNKNFKVKAENYGLNVEKDGRRGWAFTKIGEKLQIILNDIKVNKEVFKLYRQTRVSMTAPTKMKKWKCACTVIRCATELHATCDACKKSFQLEE
jgi:hypothetical protein